MLAVPVALRIFIVTNKCHLMLDHIAIIKSHVMRGMDRKQA